MNKLILVLFVLVPTLSYSQSDTTYWNKGGSFGANFNQATLKNWSAGGSSSISGSVFFKQIFDYQKNDVLWQNTIDMGLGWIKEGSSGQKKADDRLNLNSSYGRKISSSNNKWFYNVALDFRTQFVEGYSENDVDQTQYISKFMAPGYLLTSLGIDWRPNEYFNVSIGPVASKFTFVYDDYLSSIGAFGVDKASNVRSEFGANLSATFNKEIWTNVQFTSNLILFSNYLDNPEKIDVNWENVFTLKVNDFLSANIYNQLIYDYDIKFQDTDIDGNPIGSPEDRWQFKNILSLGISYNFGGSRG